MTLEISRTKSTKITITSTFTTHPTIFDAPVQLTLEEYQQLLQGFFNMWSEMIKKHTNSSSTGSHASSSIDGPLGPPGYYPEHKVRGKDSSL